MNKYSGYAKRELIYDLAIPLPHPPKGTKVNKQLSYRVNISTGHYSLVIKSD